MFSGEERGVHAMAMFQVYMIQPSATACRAKELFSVDDKIRVVQALDDLGQIILKAVGRRATPKDQEFFQRMKESPSKTAVWWLSAPPGANNRPEDDPSYGTSWKPKHHRHHLR